MSWMASAVVAAGAISAGASAYGANQASDAAAAGNAMTAGSSGMSVAEAQAAQRAQQPYTSIGYSAAPLYQWLVTGAKPETKWTVVDDARFNDLTARETDIVKRYEQLMGPGSMRSNYRKVRAAQWEAVGLKADLEELQRLRQRKSQADALSQYSDPSKLITDNPMYGLQQKLGEKAINRSLAARGMWNSSAGLSQLNNFNESLLANERNRTIGDLYNAMNVGRGAATTASNYGTGAAADYGNTMRAYGQGVTAAGAQQGMNYASLGAIPGNALAAYQQYRNFSPATSGWQTSGSGAIIGQYNPSYNNGMTPEQYRLANNLTYIY